MFVIKNGQVIGRSGGGSLEDGVEVMLPVDYWRWILGEGLVIGEVVGG